MTSIYNNTFRSLSLWSIKPKIQLGLSTARTSTLQAWRVAVEKVGRISPKTWTPTLANFSPLTRGLLLGGGGCLLAGLTVYGLHRWLSAQKPGRPAPVIEPGRSEPVIQRDALLEEPSVAPVRLSLTHAMRIFKNYNPILAAKYEDKGTLVGFLEACLKHYPEMGESRAKLTRLVEIQEELEREGGDIGKICQFYEAWLSDPEMIEPFCFFVVMRGEVLPEYILVELSKDNAPSREDFKKYVLLAKQHYVGGLNPSLSALAKTPREAKNGVFAHLLHRAIGSSTSPSFVVSKKIYKIGLLRQALLDYPLWHADPDFRGWISTVLIHLRKGVSTLQLLAGDSLQKEWTEALGFLKMTENILLQPPTVPNALPRCEFPLLQVDGVHLTPQIAYPGTERANQGDLNLDAPIEEVIPPGSLPLYETRSHLQLVGEWHSYFFAKYRQDNLLVEELESEVCQFLRCIPPANKTLLFLASLSEAEKEELVILLGELVNLSLTLHLGNDRLLLHPSRFLGLLRALDLMLTTVQKIDDAQFAEFKLDTDVLLLALTDPYLDIGPYQNALIDTLQSMKRKVGMALDLTKLGTMVYNRCEGESYLLALHQFRSPGSNGFNHKFAKGVRCDFEGTTLPKSVAALRKANLLINSFALPHQLIDYGVVCTDREKFSKYVEDLKEHLRLGSVELINGRQLLSVASETEIFPLKVRYTFPLNDLRYRDGWLLKVGAPTSPYYAWGPIRNGEIRTRLAEGLLVTRVSDGVDPDGSPPPCPSIYSSDFIRQKSLLHGLRQLQYSVHQRKFVFPHTTLEISRDLQKMVSGQNNRAINALYLFGKHPHLLCQNYYRKDYQRVFRLMLFSGTLLKNELQLNSGSSVQTLRNFDSMLSIAERSGEYDAWCFLYEAQADVLASLPQDHPAYQERQSMHAAHSASLSRFVQKADQGDSLFVGLRSTFHCSFLYGHAVIGGELTNLPLLVKSYRLVKGRIEKALIQSPFQGQILFDFGQKLCKQIVEQIDQNGTSSLDFIVGSNSPLAWEKISRGIYRTNTLLVDLNRLQVIQNGQIESLLPKEIRENALFKELFSNQILKGLFSFSLVETPLGKACYVSIVDKGTQYAMYMRSNDPNFPILYRYRCGYWEQSTRILSSQNVLPADLQNGLIWYTGGQFEVEHPNGQKLYRPTFEGNRLIQLERSVDGRQELVLNPTDRTLFERIGGADGFIVTRTPTGAPALRYLRSNIQYIWNVEVEKWESLGFKGYYLTNKSLGDWISVSKKRIGTRTGFFQSTFRFYHLLESSEGKGKLLLPFRAFEGFSPQGIMDEQELKYSWGVVPEAEVGSVWSPQNIIAFDLTAKAPPYSNRPTDLLYLSYLLFIQRNYTEAMRYLERSQAIWTAISEPERELRDQIRSWFSEWNDPSPNATAFMAKMFLLEHRLRDSAFASESAVLANDETFLTELFTYAEGYHKNIERVEPALKLTRQDNRDIAHLAPRAYKLQKQLTNLHRWLSSEDEKKYSTKTRGEILQLSLDAEIDGLEQNPPPQINLDTTSLSYVPAPLFDITLWLAPLSENQDYKDAHTRGEALVGELREMFCGDTLADQIGTELALDIERHAAKAEAAFTIASDVSLEEINSILRGYEQNWLKQETFCRQAIVHFFIASPSSIGQSIEMQLREQETLYDDHLEKARHCFGVNDFGPLEEMGAIHPSSLEELKRAIRDYEVVRTDRQLITRKREAVERLQKNLDNAVLREECANILQEWRQYDVETHPYAHLLLVMEDELNITARDKQLLHVNHLIAHEDVYIHEAMAGGKTTFLRNVFSSIENQKGRLAGVMTYGPLMTMHHREYADVNKRILGATSCPIYYHRNAPHDVTALKMMIIQHLRALRHGRMDQTPQSAISLNHTLTEMVCSLDAQSDKVIEELTPAIRALQKLLKIRSDYLSVYSDEIDKIFDRKEFNYAVGEVSILQRKYYQPALLLIRYLMENPALIHVKNDILQSRLAKISQQTFEDHLRKLAIAAFEDLKLPFDKEITLDYLTERHQENPVMQTKILNFYEKIVLPHKENDPEAVLNLQMLHSFIGVLLRGMKNKLVGTDFGRAKNGVDVKPFSFSAVCQESSQRSFVLSTVLEICVDYFVSGVGVKAAGAYVGRLKAIATGELEDLEHLDLTPTATTFFHRFGVNLSEATPDVFPAIAKVLDGSYPLFEGCLMEILLKNFSYYEKKIEGNAHDLPHLVAHFSGSSGSPERVKTLPNSVRKLAHLARQEGAVGSVFHALLKDFDPETDMVPLDLSQPPEPQIAGQLQRGDTFIDNAPFFSGKRGEEIVDSIAAQAKHLQVYRFLNEADEVCVKRGNQLSKSEQGIDFNEVVSIIPHKGRQGTNWVFAKGTTGLVEVGVTTELTSFYQSLMRLRILGKGQKAKILFDKILEESWAKEALLDGRSLLAKNIWTLVHNEASLLKNLHYHANRKEIKSVRTHAMNAIKQKVSDIKALALIKALPEFEMTQKVGLDPKKCGRPIILGDSVMVLEALIESEKTQLTCLLKEIEDLPIEQEVILQCEKILAASIRDLRVDALIMDARDLPAKAPSLKDHADTEATEEIEVQVDVDFDAQAQADAQAQVSQDVAIDMETEISQGMELSTETELFRAYDHPDMPSDEGNEWYEYTDSAPIDSLHFPGIRGSQHAFGLYRKRIKIDPNSVNEWRQRMWCYSEPESQTCFSSKVLVLLEQDGTMTLQMSSVKEGDLFFNEALYEVWARQHEWTDVTFEEARNLEPSALSARQYKAIESGKEAYDKAKDGPVSWHYQFLTKRGLRGEFYFKVDLHELGIPDRLPKEKHEEWVQKLALTKFLAVEYDFSAKERAYLMQWLNSFTVPLADLEMRLINYLNRYYPNARNNQLLAIIQEKRRLQKV